MIYSAIKSDLLVLVGNQEKVYYIDASWDLSD